MTEERAELEPLPSIFSKLPSASDLKKQVLDAIDGGYNQLVRARGKVTRPEDTYDVQRKLHGAVETLSEFERAFAAGRKALNSYQKDELELALGDREVQPRESMNVPDAEGDLRVAADTANVHTIDVSRLVHAVATAYLDAHVSADDTRTFAEQVTDIVNGDDPEAEPDSLPGLLIVTAAAVAHLVISCGKFEPQITKTKAYADSLARNGDDKMAAVINSAITTTVKLKGVKVERKEPK